MTAAATNLPNVIEFPSQSTAEGESIFTIDECLTTPQ